MSRHVLNTDYMKGIAHDFGGPGVIGGQRAFFPRFPLLEPQTSCHAGAEPSILATSILGFSAHVPCALASPLWL